MILSVELVPQSSWFTNLRSKLSKEKWDELRRASYRKAGYVCEICGGKGLTHPVECHETWEYDDKKLVQKLTGLISLCPLCHKVKHIGLSQMRGEYDICVKHLMVVNKWTLEQARQHIDATVRQWQKHSLDDWTIDISFVQS